MLSQLSTMAKNTVVTQPNKKFFVDQYSLKVRKGEANRILSKYPDRIPIIVEKSAQKSDLPDIDKIKYLVPHDLSIGQFMFVIRKRMKLDSTAALFCFVGNGVQPSGSQLLSTVYDYYKSEDNFLYIKYTAENTFGYYKN